ncbi:hypothetical protein ABK040_009748 [Willaertia magna]
MLFPSPSTLLKHAFSSLYSSSTSSSLTIQAEEEHFKKTITTPTIVQHHSHSLFHFLSAGVGISKHANKEEIHKIMHTNSYYPQISHSDQVFEKSSGEDSYFQTSIALGVGDGVGGWVKHGVDPSLISRAMTKSLLFYFSEKEKALMIYHKDEVKPTPHTTFLSSSSKWLIPLKSNNNNEMFIKESPINILTRVYDSIKASGSVRAGSTTFSLVMLSDPRTGAMESLNVGDSGFMIVRNNRIIYKSETQQHRFNAPYQLTICPPERAGRCIMNEPKDGSYHEMLLEEGDIVVLGTDGLFDNLFDYQILNILNQGRVATLYAKEEEAKLYKEASQGNLDAINELNQFVLSKARTIAAVAKKVADSEDPFTVTPFGQEYRKHSGKSMIGGKSDDITVVVALLVKKMISADLKTKQ